MTSFNSIEGPSGLAPQDSHGGAYFSAFAKDALRQALGRRTINIPADEQICDIVVKKNRMELMIPYMFLLMPAIAWFAWFGMDFFMHLDEPAEWPPWWAWIVLVALLLLPLMLRGYLKQFYGFELWIFTDKVLYKVHLGRQIGANLNPPVLSWKYADVKASYWSMMWPGSVPKGKGNLVLRTDFLGLRETVRLQVNGGMAHVRRLMDSLLHFTRPPQVQLADYLNFLNVPQDPSSLRREYPMSPEVLDQLHAKRRRVAIWTPITAGLTVLIMRFLVQLPSPIDMFTWIYGSIALLVVVLAPIDLIRRTRNFSNIDATMIRITDQGIELPAKNAQDATRIDFSKDWVFALSNALVTYKMTWDAMDAVEIYCLGQPTKTVFLKLGLLMPQDHKQMLFTLMQVYFAWLEKIQPDYFQSPEQLRRSFIAENPFHQELLTLVEERRQAYQQTMASTRDGISERTFLPTPTPRIGLNPLAAIRQQIASVEGDIKSMPSPHLDSIPDVGYTPEMGPLRYPLTAYSPYFADDERVMFVYHTPHPGRAFTETTNVLFIVLFVGSLIALWIMTEFSVDFLFLGIIVWIFPMIFGMFMVCIMCGTISEYWSQRNLEIVLTTNKIYWQMRGTIKLVPYANIHEVTRIRLNTKTDVYLKIRFVFKKPAAQFPSLLHYVPRTSPLFAVLSQHGVSLVEE